MIPTEDDRSRVNAAAAILEGSTTMSVSSAAGTDVRFRLGQYPVV